MTQPSLCAHVTAAMKLKALLKRGVAKPLENPNDKSAQDCNEKKEPPNGDKELADKLNAPNDEDLKAEEDFLQAPYFEVKLSGSSKSVRIPLNVRRRAGMETQSLLLFTNGRKTVIYEPAMNRYHCGVQRSVNSDEEQGDGDHDDPTAEIDPSMPIMKNAEVYATQSGSIYLIGGNIEV